MYITTIDFWTTKCVQCPSALDELNRVASEMPNTRFVSICLDKLDGAREIIEAPKDPRWQNISHYFMDFDDKEATKVALGFRSVPFYAVLDADGTILEKGSKKELRFFQPEQKQNEEATSGTVGKINGHDGVSEEEKKDGEEHDQGEGDDWDIDEMDF